MTRQILLANLRKLFRVESANQLMDVLQDIGCISSEAVHITDVPDGDIVRSWNKATL